jgi:hypothetical protein
VSRTFTLIFLSMAALTCRSAQAQSPASTENGRWVVVPATTNATSSRGSSFMFAWRLDTKTGALEMWTYDPGGSTNPTTKMVTPESLNCARPSAASTR